MPSAIGLNARAAVGTESVFGTEVAATQLLRYRSDTYDKNHAPIEDDSLLGSASRAPADQGISTIPGEIQTYLTYQLTDILLNRFFGAYTNEPTGLDHYNLTASLDDIGFTFAVDKTLSVWVCSGVKTSQFTLTGSSGGPLELSLGGFATEQTVGTSILNTTATLTALTTPARRVLFHHGVDKFWIGDHVDALTVADKFKISTFTLTLNRNLEEIYSDGLTPEQARETDFMSGELTFTIPVYASNFFVTAHRNHTPLQWVYTLTNGTNTKEFRAPYMHVVSAPVNIEGPGYVQTEVTCNLYNDLAEANASANMDFTEPIRLYES